MISAQQLPKPADDKGESRTKGEVGQDPDMFAFVWLLSSKIAVWYIGDEVVAQDLIFFCENVPFFFVLFLGY